MKKMFLVLALVSFSVSSFAADPCGSKSVKFGSSDLELIKITDKPEKTATGQDIKGEEKVLVSGIYMFVRNGQSWNVYRCADDVKRENGSPVLDLKKCVVKNDFEFGNLVKRYGDSGITVRKTDSNRLQIKLNAGGAEELDYYDVKATEKGLEVIKNQYKENKQQRYLSHHEQVSLGTCTKSGSAGSAGSTGASGSSGKAGSSGSSGKVKSAN